MDKRINKQGYVEIKIGKEWKLEHIVVMENFLERNMKPEERIHHIDSNKKNNLINNLFPFHTQKEHKHFENQVRQFGFTRPILDKIKNRFDGWIK